MAFTTEFVMGAGGAEVQEIPVSMSGSGSGTVYPLTTVDAGDGAVVLVLGTLEGSANSALSPRLQIGSYTHQSSRTELTASAEHGIGMIVTGTVEVSILSRATSTSTFDGTVYVALL